MRGTCAWCARASPIRIRRATDRRRARHRRDDRGYACRHDGRRPLANAGARRQVPPSGQEAAAQRRRTSSYPAEEKMLGERVALKTVGAALSDEVNLAKLLKAGGRARAPRNAPERLPDLG